jgi:hypothetical protein
MDWLETSEAMNESRHRGQSFTSRVCVRAAFVCIHPRDGAKNMSHKHLFSRCLFVRRT